MPTITLVSQQRTRRTARQSFWFSLSLAACFLNHQVSAAVRKYPQRHQAEAAVIEWGHSAIISALDAVVAEFGPQSSQAALMEVETTPILASPISADDLKNADEFHGNVAIVTDTKYTGYELAKLFQSHGAAAVVVVRVDPEQPDAVMKIVKPDDADVEIDIPVVSISWTAATVLTTALLPEDHRRAQASSELSPDGLPERYVYTQNDFVGSVSHAHHYLLQHSLVRGRRSTIL